MKKITFHGVKGERITMVEKQNKRCKKSHSASYGDLRFWKSWDFWESVGLYVALFALLYIAGLAVSVL